MKTAAKVFIIIGIVVGVLNLFNGIFTLTDSANDSETAWGVSQILLGAASVVVGGFTLSKLSSATCRQDVTVVGILSLLFCNFIAGILILASSDRDYSSARQSYDGMPPYGNPNYPPYGGQTPPYGNNTPYNNTSSPYGNANTPNGTPNTPYGTPASPYANQNMPPYSGANPTTYGVPFGAPVTPAPGACDGDAPASDAARTEAESLSGRMEGTEPTGSSGSSDGGNPTIDMTAGRAGTPSSDSPSPDAEDANASGPSSGAKDVKTDGDSSAE